MNMVYVFLFQQGVYMLDVLSLQDDAMCRKKHMWTSGLSFLSAAQGPRLSPVQEGAHNTSCRVLHLSSFSLASTLRLGFNREEVEPRYTKNGQPPVRGQRF